MRRRQYLTLIGAASIAGCTGDGTESIDTPEPTESGPGETEAATEPSSEDTSTASETETETTAERGEADVRIGETELRVDDGQFSTDVFVEAEIVNQGSAPSGQVTLMVDWQTENGDFLDTAEETLVSIGAGETWLARVYYFGTQADQIDDFEASGEFEETPPSVPNGVELLESQLNVEDDDIIVTGRVENGTGAELSYLEAHGKLYDDDGNVLQSAWTNETDIPTGGTWAFEVNALQTDRWSAVADHEVVLSERF